MRAAGENILAVFKPEFLTENLITPAQWREIPVPTLVVAAIDDRPLYVKTARTIAGLIPQASLVEVDKVGHWPQFENPARLNRLIADFLLTGKAA